jgi:hypothetical protein
MSNLALPESISDAWDILTSEARSELMFMASYKPGPRHIVIRMGNFKKIRVPLNWIEENYPNVAIDPVRLSILGMGQILVLGDCEVDVVDILNKFN